MKGIVLLAGITCLALSLRAQTDPSKDYTNFPIILTVQFHCFALPFRDVKSNFSNIGIGIGTEVSYNGKQNWVQQVSAVWYHNKALGNGLLFYSQSVWRPALGSDAYTELKAGIGYLYSFLPTEGFTSINGKWTSAGHQGKGMLTVPMGISIGRNIYSSGVNYSPFISYQFLPVIGYNRSIPLVPETLVQAGIRMHLK